MSVLDRAALEDSPLADLHALASELGIDGFRRLRKAELIDAIIERQGGEEAAEAPKPRRRSRAKAEPEAAPDEEPAPRGRSRAKAEPKAAAEAEAEEETGPAESAT